MHFIVLSRVQADNMPVGNGKLVANVWVDGMHNGSLALLLGRSDVFSEWAQPMKLGRLRLLLDPNPFTAAAVGPACRPLDNTTAYAEHSGMIGDQKKFVVPDFPCTSQATCQAEAQAKCDDTPNCRSFAIDPAWHGPGEKAAAQLYSSGLVGASTNAAWTLWVRPCNDSAPATTSFTQELDIETATVTIRANGSGVSVNVRVWSDATATDVDGVYVEVESSVPVSVVATLDPWRTAPFQQDTSRDARGPCENPVTIYPDVFIDPAQLASLPGTVGWMRRNNISVFNETMTRQMLGRLASSMTDPLLGRASGATVTGTTANAGAFTTVNATTIRSRTPSTTHVVQIATATEIATPSDTAFVTVLASKAAKMVSPLAARGAHVEWWSKFFNRSWVALTQDPGGPMARKGAPYALSQAHALTRCVCTMAPVPFF
jgi:hypothetical protein